MNLKEIQNIKIKDFTYDLPEDRIAKYPLAERDLSKLLVYKKGTISEDTYGNIGEYIPENSLLIFNDTKVIQARIYFQDSSGKNFEIFCLEPEENAEPVSLMVQTKSVRWKCMVGKASKWKEKFLTHQSENVIITAVLISRDPNYFTIEFSWSPDTLTFAEVLDKIGEMPIPPYLKRGTEDIDLNRYQTIYARQEGSVAAPTAGLHFTQNVFDQLSAKGIEKEYVTLHVGAGTFKPVKSETIEDHDMHAEWIDVNLQTIEHILKFLGEDKADKKLISVGTTSLRTLESLYWMGVKVSKNGDLKLEEIEIQQWDPYELNDELETVIALKSLTTWLRQNNCDRLVCKTKIIIVPSYKLKVADALITNFHQPNSTLLLLVAAVNGSQWREIYDYALDHNFRFLSYGDGSLLFKNEEK